MHVMTFGQYNNLLHDQTCHIKGENNTQKWYRVNVTKRLPNSTRKIKTHMGATIVNRLSAKNIYFLSCTFHVVFNCFKLKKSWTLNPIQSILDYFASISHSSIANIMAICACFISNNQIHYAILVCPYSPLLTFQNKETCNTHVVLTF